MFILLSRNAMFCAIVSVDRSEIDWLEPPSLSRTHWCGMSATMQVDIRVAVCIMQPRFVRLCFGQVVTTTIDISQDRADRAVTHLVHRLHTPCCYTPCNHIPYPCLRWGHSPFMCTHTICWLMTQLRKTIFSPTSCRKQPAMPVEREDVCIENGESVRVHGSG